MNSFVVEVLGNTISHCLSRADGDNTGAMTFKSVFESAYLRLQEIGEIN